ncbi:MAG: MauE/DoxX family redox-associated membrane protein [Acidimicrobiales bacterium]
MATAGLVAAMVLAAVFVRAGAAKLARPGPAAATFRTLGVPIPAFMARALPVAELVLAVVLIAAPVAGGMATFVLLASFSALLARALGSGLNVGCNCFGSASTKPVSRRDLVRNALLAVLAVAATGLSWAGG